MKFLAMKLLKELALMLGMAFTCPFRHSIRLAKVRITLLHLKDTTVLASR